jgi:hypothetical protein
MITKAALQMVQGGFFVPGRLDAQNSMNNIEPLPFQRK